MKNAPRCNHAHRKQKQRKSIAEIIALNALVPRNYSLGVTYSILQDSNYIDARLCHTHLDTQPYHTPLDTPFHPNFLRASTAVLPLSELSLETTESAGWDTMAQNTPAM